MLAHIYLFLPAVWLKYSAQNARLAQRYCAGGLLDLLPAAVLSFGYDPLIMRVRSMLLHAEGYEVTETYSWNEAVQLISARNFDLVLMCHTVPEEQQKVLVERAGALHPSMPVLCLSADPGIKYAGNCTTASNTAPELLRQIDEALGKSKERRAA